MQNNFENSQLCRNKNIFASDIDNEVVMLDIEAGKYYGMNPVAKRVWEMLETPMSFGDILQTLTQEYDVSQEQCAADITPFIDSLIENGLIDVNSAS